MTGQRYGRLVVLGRVARRAHVHVLCRCVCGRCVIVRADHLKSSATTSCGCRAREVSRQRGLVGAPEFARRARERLTTHGMSGTPTYKAWTGMRKRCRNPNTVGWEYYGGAGVTVCARWDSFANFLADLGERPAPGLSLDRISSDGPYAPGNVRWTDAVTQARNRRPRRWRKRPQP